MQEPRLLTLALLLLLLSPVFAAADAESQTPPAPASTQENAGSPQTAAVNPPSTQAGYLIGSGCVSSPSSGRTANLLRA